MDFKNIIGNTDVKEYLDKSIDQNNILHSYLFVGTEGIGKLLVAQEFARKILCLNTTKDETCTCKSCTCFRSQNHPDFHIINENGENIKIDTIREITEKVIEKPIISNRKVYIINDSDKMKLDSQNCLLKTLEEPPEFIVFILIASNENFILNTIKSRCMTIKFKNIENNLLKEYAENTIGYENISENLLKSFDGSIGKAIKVKDNNEKYEEIEKLIDNFEKKDIIDILLDAKILYDKDNIFDILDYMIVCLKSKSNQNEKYLDCIQYVSKCLNRLRFNSNFDMSIDDMLFKIWEEINESSNRS